MQRSQIGSQYGTSRVAKFERDFKYRPDHNGLQGYMTPYIIKAVTEKVGKVDRKVLMEPEDFLKAYPGA